MSGSPETTKSLREALYDTLAAILSPHHELRRAAEERLQALEVTEDFGVHLTEFIVEKSINIAIRQLSSVLLKQYVEEHWCSLSEKFRSPEAPEKSKAIIRRVLPEGLKEPCSKVHSVVAYAVSAIAQWDWPEKWPELFDLLISYLSGDESTLLGALNVLYEFAGDVSYYNLPHVAPIMLNEMFRIISSDQKYNTRSRSKAIKIFTNCAYKVCVTSEYQKGLAKTLLQPVLPMYSNKFTEILQGNYGQIIDPGLKAEVVKAIVYLVQHLPKQMAPCIQQILPPVWQTFVQAAEVYKRDYVNCPDVKVQPVDSDGESIGLDAVIFSIVELINALIEISIFHETVKAALPDLIYYLILFIEITDEQAIKWNEKPDRYIDEEDEHTYVVSVRILARDLLNALFDEYEAESIEALREAITKHLQAAEVLRNAGNSDWWRIHESCMCAVQIAHETVLDLLEHEKVYFDINGFLQNIILADINQTDSPYLIGRCLRVGSCYAKCMSSSILEQFIQATVSGMQENQAHQIRISAVRALYGFCTNLKDSQNVDCLKVFLPSVTEGLLGMVNQFTPEFLSSVLETLAVVLSLDSALTAPFSAKIIPLAIAVFLKFSSDHSIISVTIDIFRELCLNPESLVKLEQRFVPTLVSILNAPQDKIVTGLAANAMEALQTIVRNSRPPLSEALINCAFPAAAQCIQRSADSAIIQNGAECLRTYVSVSVEQVFSFRDAEGKTGLDYLMQTSAVLLNPSSSGISVGNFVVTLISKAGHLLGQNVDLLLRAVLSKMQRADSLSVTQSLIMVFAQLVHHKLEEVLNFLSSVPGPTGQSALHFVFEEWVYRHSYFYGDYEMKVSTLALCKILKYGVSSNDERLNSIVVKGDQIYVHTDTGGVKTRSQSQKNFNEWTSVPLLVKIFKLLLNELSHVLERKDASCEVQTESEEEWEDDNGAENKLSSLLDEPESHDDSLRADDPDILNDPLYKVDMIRHVTELALFLGQQSFFHVFRQHLNEKELNILRKLGISA